MMVDACVWCSNEPLAEKLIPKIVQNFSSQRLSKDVCMDLAYCLQCMLAYHRAKDKHTARFPDDDEILQKFEIKRLKQHFKSLLNNEKKKKQRQSADHSNVFSLLLDDDNLHQDIDFEERCKVPCQEILQFPYLLFNKEIMECFVKSFLRLDVLGYQMFSDPSEERLGGIYVLLFTENEKIRDWAIKSVQRCGTISTDNLDDLRDLLPCLLQISSDDRKRHIATANDTKTLYSAPPAHLFQSTSRKDVWLAYGVILNVLESDAVSLLLSDDPQSAFLDAVCSQLLYESQDFSSAVFWPLMHAFIVLLKKINSSLWLMTERQFDARAMLNVLTDNAFLEGELRWWLRHGQSSFSHTDDEEDCEEIITSSQVIYNDPVVVKNAETGEWSAAVHKPRSSDPSVSHHEQSFQMLLRWVKPFIVSILDLNETVAVSVCAIIKFLLKILGTVSLSSRIRVITLSSLLDVFEKLNEDESLYMMTSHADKCLDVLWSTAVPNKSNEVPLILQCRAQILFINILESVMTLHSDDSAARFAKCRTKIERGQHHLWTAAEEASHRDTVNTAFHRLNSLQKRNNAVDSRPESDDVVVKPPKESSADIVTTSNQKNKIVKCPGLTIKDAAKDPKYADIIKNLKSYGSVTVSGCEFEDNDDETDLAFLEIDDTVYTRGKGAEDDVIVIESEDDELLDDAMTQFESHRPTVQRAKVESPTKKKKRPFKANIFDFLQQSDVESCDGSDINRDDNDSETDDTTFEKFVKKYSDDDKTDEVYSNAGFYGRQKSSNESRPSKPSHSAERRSKQMATKAKLPDKPGSLSHLTRKIRRMPIRSAPKSRVESPDMMRLNAILKARREQSLNESRTAAVVSAPEDHLVESTGSIFNTVQPIVSKNLLKESPAKMIRDTPKTTTAQPSARSFPRPNESLPPTTSSSRPEQISPSKLPRKLPKIDGSVCHKYSVDNAVRLLLGAEPAWLHSGANADQEFLSKSGMSLKVMAFNFSSYQSYMESIWPMVVLETWAAIVSATDQSKARFEMRGQGDSVPSNSSSERLVIYTTDVDTSRHHTPYPIQERQFVLLKSKLDGIHGNATYEAFGYVETVKAKGTRRTHGGSVVSTFDVYVKVRSTAVLDATMDMITISSLAATLRQLEALLKLPKLRLAYDVIFPFRPCVFAHDASTQVTTVKDSLLNASQQKAATAIVTAMRAQYGMPKVSLLQGPPGTGKSVTLHAIISRLLKHLKNDVTENGGSKPRLLVCAPSNAALDQLFCKFIASVDGKAKSNSEGHSCSADSRRTVGDLKLVRIARNESTTHPRVRPFLLDTMATERSSKNRDQASTRMEQKEIATLEKKLKELEKERTSLTASKDLSKRRRLGSNTKRREEILPRLTELRHRFTSTYQKECSNSSELLVIKRNILMSSDVVFCTLNMAGSSIMTKVFLRDWNARQGHPFSCVIVDEAGQCCETDALIPLQYCGGRLVLVGDPAQLPATVISNEARKYGFGMSLFERMYNSLIDNGVTDLLMLDQQYRMHPEICAFPSSQFYEGKVTTAKCVYDRHPLPIMPYIVFNVTKGRQQRCQTTGSLANVTEVEFVIAIVSDLLSREQTRRLGIGVVSPYRSQCQAVKNAMIARNVSQVEATTIDGFQGREKDILILSCVRANHSDDVGFLQNQQRMNVALTRAKRSLIILVNAASVISDRDWSKLIEDARRRSLYFDVASPDDALRQLASTAVATTTELAPPDKPPPIRSLPTAPLSSVARSMTDTPPHRPTVERNNLGRSVSMEEGTRLKPEVTLKTPSAISTRVHPAANKSCSREKNLEEAVSAARERSKRPHRTLLLAAEGIEEWRLHGGKRKRVAHNAKR